MTKYYYVGVSLPELSMRAKPELSFSDFVILLYDNLKNSDYEKIKVVRLYHDLLNIRAFWLGEEIDLYGNLDKNALEDSLIAQTFFPPYVFAFMDQYPTKEARIEHFPELISRYFREVALKEKGFLQNYFNFERELRLVLTAFRAKKLQRDLLVELQYENPEDKIVAQILAQKDAKIFEPPEGFEDLKAILEEHYQDPLGLAQALFEYRFYKIEGMVKGDVFSMDRILAYMIQLIMVEKWIGLDQKKGMEIVDTILREAS